MYLADYVHESVEEMGGKSSHGYIKNIESKDRSRHWFKWFNQFLLHEYAKNTKLRIKFVKICNDVILLSI